LESLGKEGLGMSNFGMFSKVKPDDSCKYNAKLHVNRTIALKSSISVIKLFKKKMKILLIIRIPSY